jgi:hypothetical protein
VRNLGNKSVDCLWHPPFPQSRVEAAAPTDWILCVGDIDEQAFACPRSDAPLGRDCPDPDVGRAINRRRSDRGRGSALQFDGRNDYVTFGAAPSVGVTTFTLEAWVKRAPTAAKGIW